LAPKLALPIAGEISCRAWPWKWPWNRSPDFVRPVQKKIHFWNLVLPHRFAGRQTDL